MTGRAGKIDRVAVLAEYERGDRIGEIARRHGCDQSYVCLIVRRAGAQMRADAAWRANMVRAAADRALDRRWRERLR